MELSLAWHVPPDVFLNADDVVIATAIDILEARAEAMEEAKK